MRAKLRGHGLQFLGSSLVFLGLAVVIAALVIAGRHPAVPLWAFVAGGGAVAAPLMVAGGRINGRGRGRVLGQSSEQAAREYRTTTTLMALHLGLTFLLVAFITAPLFARALGLVNVGDAFVKAWVIGWMLTLCASREWVTRPVWRAVERRVLGPQYGGEPGVTTRTGGGPFDPHRPAKRG
jgi:Na+-driven multidrug efflux pump